jgi:hypothetical protein
LGNECRVPGLLFDHCAGCFAISTAVPQGCAGCPPAPTRTIFHDGRWTPEEIATVFSRTFGHDLVNPAPPKDA